MTWEPREHTWKYKYRDTHGPIQFQGFRIKHVEWQQNKEDFRIQINKLQSKGTLTVDNHVYNLSVIFQKLKYSHT